MNEEQAERVVDAVLRNLLGRGGFSDVWDSCDQEIRDEIVASLRASVLLAAAG